MPGMTGKRKQPLASGGRRAKKPRRPTTHRSDHDGVTASNGSASHHAGQSSFADDASEDDLDTLPAAGNVNAYSALLGALSRPTREAHSRSPAAVAGTGAGKSVSATKGSNRHAQHRVAADSVNPVHADGKRGDPQQAAAATTVSSAPSAKQTSNSRKCASHALSHGLTGGSDGAAAAQDPAPVAVPAPADSSRDVHADGAGGWGLRLENNALNAHLGGDGAEPLTEASADENTPVQDFFSAHFDRC